jgi:hypothetical protein
MFWAKQPQQSFSLVTNPWFLTKPPNVFCLLFPWCIFGQYSHTAWMLTNWFLLLLLILSLKSSEWFSGLKVHMKALLILCIYNVWHMDMFYWQICSPQEVGANLHVADSRYKCQICFSETWEIVGKLAQVYMNVIGNLRCGMDMTNVNKGVPN